MLIVALLLAIISLAALVTAVVTSNELIAWVCIGFSAFGVLLLIVDAVRDRNRRPAPTPVVAPVGGYDDETEVQSVDLTVEQAVDPAVEQAVEQAVEDYPDEVVYDDPDHDLPDDDEPDYPVAAEEAAMHIISDEELVAQADSDKLESEVHTHIESDAPGSYTVVYSEGPADAPTDGPSYVVTDGPSYMVTETSTVSDADTVADDSVVVIYSSEASEEERGGER